MARPKGYRLNGPAFLDILKAKRLDLSEAARLCKDDRGEPMPLTTLSGLVNDNHGASMRTVRQVCAGLDLAAEGIFPELSGRWAYLVRNSADEAA